jgi:protein involved in polysaccharide export with SLBB domain
MRMKSLLVVYIALLSLVLGLTTPTCSARGQTWKSFYVAGEVIHPGEFAWKAGLTFRQAISLAEGIKFSADSSRTVIFRKAAEGKREEIKVDLRAVMNGKANDLGIEADDVIVIPRKRPNDN